MTTKPRTTTARKPASEILQDEMAPEGVAEVDMTGVPLFRPVTTLRAKQRTPLLALAAKFRNMHLDESMGEDEDSLLLVNDLLGEIDEVMENYALDQEEYVNWALSPRAVAQLPVLFARYVEELGDFMHSAS